MGLIADQLKAQLHALAQSDARMYRSLDKHLTTTRRLLDEMKEPATGNAIQDAITLLEANGYTVTR